jgi:hypothetical protein
VISSLAGVSGLAVVRAIVAGERSPERLLALCDQQIRFFCVMARSLVRSKNIALGGFYRRMAARRGGLIATMALARDPHLVRCLHHLSRWWFATLAKNARCPTLERRYSRALQRP